MHHSNGFLIRFNLSIFHSFNVWDTIAGDPSCRVYRGFYIWFVSIRKGDRTGAAGSWGRENNIRNKQANKQTKDSEILKSTFYLGNLSLIVELNGLSRGKLRPDNQINFV